MNISSKSIESLNLTSVISSVSMEALSKHLIADLSFKKSQPLKSRWSILAPKNVYLACSRLLNTVLARIKVSCSV